MLRTPHGVLFTLRGVSDFSLFSWQKLTGVECEGGSSGGNPEVKSIGEHREGNALFSSAASPLFPS